MKENKEITDIKNYFNINEFTIIKFRILKCQNRLLLYLKKDDCENKKIKYNYGAIVDLEQNIKFKGLVAGYGVQEDNNICTNFDGSLVFSVFLKEKLYFVANTIKSENHQFMNEKKHNLSLKEFEDEEEEIPPAMCFSEKESFLFVADRKGWVFTYFIDPKVNKRNLQLEVHFPELEIPKNEDYEKDYIEEMLVNWDQNYLICRTQHSRILIYKIEKKKLGFVKEYQFNNKLHQMTLSKNGRFLAVCGFFFESIGRIDLSSIDGASFGDQCYDLIKYEESRASEEGKKNANAMKDRYDKIKCYRYGSINKYIVYLKERKKINNIKNEQNAQRQGRQDVANQRDNING